MPSRPLFTARRSGSASGREVVDQDLVRVAYIPARDFQPAVLDRRAGIIAAALMHEAISAESLTIRDVSNPTDGSMIQVWDGGMQLADFVYTHTAMVSSPQTIHVEEQIDWRISREGALSRANALADGYLIARRLCLGERT